MTVAQRKWSIFDAQQSWLANIHNPNRQPLGDSRPTEMKYIWRPTVLASNIHHTNYQPLGDSRPTEMKHIWRPTVPASKYTSVAQRKWSIYDAQLSWLANIHHANHQPLGDSRPTEMKYIWRPGVLASKYTSCKSSTVRWQSPNGNEVYMTPYSPG